MNPALSISDRIDEAFGPLLMAKNVMDNLVTHSDCDQSIAMAESLSLDLIRLAVDMLLVGESAKGSAAIAILQPRHAV